MTHCNYSGSSLVNPLLVGKTEILPFPVSPGSPVFGRYYIIKYGRTNQSSQFLHKDGRWYQTADVAGSWPDHEAANNALKTKIEANNKHN